MRWATERKLEKCSNVILRESLRDVLMNGE